MHYKSYEGNPYLKNQKEYSKETIRFYDEREWRYIPLKCNGLNLNLDRTKFENEDKLKIENKKIQQNNKLKFSIEDIKSIHLQNENETSQFLNSIAGKYTKSELMEIRSYIKIND